MAEENKKIPQGGEGSGSNNRPHRPHRSRHGGKGHRPPYGKKPEQKAEGAKPQEQKQEKPLSKGGGQPSAPKRDGAKNQQRRNPQQEQRKRPQRDNRDNGKQQTAPSQQKPQKEQVLSPRRRQMQELMTAEQRAFAEATDIMLEEQERRANAPEEQKEEGAKVEIVGVRFRPTGKIYYFSPLDIQFSADDGVIVETARGQEYGFVALANRYVDEKETVQPLKPVVRKATEADTVKHQQNKKQEEKAVKVWEELVAKHKLSMSLTDIEYTFDNTKLIFYFTAEGRVDFRELVKDLAAVFRTRIELRQIGVRDEAKLVGGLGVCGMPFCCNRFLPDFVQVSIKMAKEQNLSLSSSKISGNCGRLMCCLRYEQDVYEKEYETFPRTDMVVRTAQGTGVIIESNFLNGKIKVLMDGEGSAVYKTFTRDEVKVIGKAKRRDNEPIDKELKALED